MLETMLGPNLAKDLSPPHSHMEEKGLAASQLGLDDVLLVERFVTQHALEAEARDVDRPLASSDDLGDGAAGGRRLLQAVAGEAVTQYHVGHVRVPARGRLGVDRGWEVRPRIFCGSDSRRMFCASWGLPLYSTEP